MYKRILIVDHSASIRGLVKAVIGARSDLEICGEAANGQEGIAKGLELKPDLIILDFAMLGMNGLEAVAELHLMLPKAPIILFTFQIDVISARVADEAGISSVLSKWDQLGTLADEVTRLTA